MTGARPALVAHADWSSGRAGRALALARRDGAGWTLAEASAEPAAGLIGRLLDEAAGGRVLLGFDFPIGLPARYAALAGIAAFPAFLRELDAAAWERFRTPAEVAVGPSLPAPFYPRRAGGAARGRFATGLGLGYGELLRRCDRPTAARRAACMMFWTLGGQQCGRAALAGWHEVLRPALRTGADLGLWPFDGPLRRLLDRHPLVVAETYPAELYRAVLELPRRFSKRRQASRAACAAGLRASAARQGVRIAAPLEAAIAHGFGAGADGDDRFDAVVGVLGMLAVLAGAAPADPPDDLVVRRVEGWMLGLCPG